MAIPRWASESAGNGAQPVVGGDTRLRGRPELSGHSDVPGRRSGRMISLPLVVVVVEGQRYLVSMLGAEVDWVRNVKAARWQCHALRHGRREEVHLEEVPANLRAPRAEGLLETGAWREAASAHSQRCAAFRVRAGVLAVPRVPGRTEERRTWPSTGRAQRRASVTVGVRVIYLDTIPFNLAVDPPRCTLRIVSEDDVPFVWSVSRFPGFTAG